MDFEHGNLVMQTPGDTESILSVAEHTNFLLFDVERRNDLRTNLPNPLNPSETKAIVSIAMSKIYDGLGRSTHEEKKEAKRAADLIDTIVDLMFKANSDLESRTEAQADLARQVIDTVNPPAVEPQSV